MNNVVVEHGMRRARWGVSCLSTLLVVLGAGCGAAGSGTVTEKLPAEEELSSSVGALQKQTLTPPIASDNPYAVNVVQTWKVKTPGCATYFKIHFDYIELEEGYDFLRITDESGQKVKSYTGFFRGWSPELTGDEATIELISDGANTGKGFSIDAIEYASDDGTGIWTKETLSAANAFSTPHPYPQGFAQNWTVKAPAGATKVRVRFKGFETEARYDFVSLFTGDMTQVATYSGNLGDFVSNEVNGDTAVIRLSSDFSANGYGFDVVEYEWFKPGGAEGKCTPITGCLIVSPNPHDFGNVELTCNGPTKTFTVQNNCDAEVKLDSLELTGGTVFPFLTGGCTKLAGCPEFVLHAAPNIPATGLTIPPKSNSVSFAVRYDSGDLGADKGEVKLRSTENGAPVTYTVNLEGTGDNSGRNLDTFTVDSVPKADILFVVDDSGSMGPHQASLAQNFSSFIQYAKQANVDFRLAVTTTSVQWDPTLVANDGNFISGSLHPETVLTPGTPGLDTKFKAKVAVGTYGSATEQCFEASYRALGAAKLSSVNAGFLRPDASLAVICVTDEEEQSPQTTDFYLNALLALKGSDANKVTYNVIAGLKPELKCATSIDTSGRLAELASRTSGVAEDICAPDWAKSLQILGKTAAGHRTSFTLTAAPDPQDLSSVVVKRNGQVVPAVDAQGKKNWHIDLAKQSLEFEEASAPSLGQKITVEYWVTCQ